MNVGMYLLVKPNGGKYFRFDYRFEGKRKTLAFGTYPDTTLKEAREKQETAKQLITNGGLDPGIHRQKIKIKKMRRSIGKIGLIKAYR